MGPMEGFQGLQCHLEVDVSFSWLFPAFFLHSLHFQWPILTALQLEKKGLRALRKKHPKKNSDWLDSAAWVSGTRSPGFIVCLLESGSWD